MPQNHKTINAGLLLESVGELSNELEFFGLLPLPKYRSLEGSSGLDQYKLAYLLTAIINAGFDLMQHHRVIVQEHSEADEKRQRLIDDCTTIRATVERLETNVKEKEHLLNEASEQERKLKVKYDKALGDLKKEQDEVRRLKLQLHHEGTQSAHALRRKEQEVAKLEDQLRGRKPHPKPLTPNEVEASNKAQEKEKLYKRVICKFEMNNQTLMKENLSLHRLFYKVNTSLNQLVTEYSELLAVACNQEKREAQKTKERHLKLGKCASKMRYEPSVEDCNSLSLAHIEELYKVLETLRGSVTTSETKFNAPEFPLDPKLEMKQEIEV